MIVLAVSVGFTQPIVGLLSQNQRQSFTIKHIYWSCLVSRLNWSLMDTPNVENSKKCMHIGWSCPVLIMLSTLLKHFVSLQIICIQKRISKIYSPMQNFQILPSKYLTESLLLISTFYSLFSIHCHCLSTSLHPCEVWAVVTVCESDVCSLDSALLVSPSCRNNEGSCQSFIQTLHREQ